MAESDAARATAVEGLGGVSFVCPAMNEARHIQETLRALHAAIVRQGFPFELLLVDDGSTDRTGDLVQALVPELPGLRLLRNPANLGIGGSVRRGVQEAVHDYVMWIPTNGMLDPESAVSQLGDRSPDVLIAFYVANQHVRPWGRRVLSAAYDWGMRTVFGIREVPYVHGVPLLPRRRVRLEDLRVNHTFFLVELFVHAVRVWGLRVIPKTCRLQRATGVEKTKSFRLRNMGSIAAHTVELRVRLARRLAGL